MPPSPTPPSLAVALRRDVRRPATGRHVGDPLKAGRLHGVDVARALAIVGMIAVHTGPTDGTDLLGRLYALPYGRASLLFVLVAGVGVTLLARSRRATVADARATLLWRAALLLPAGLLLQQGFDHRANVILQAYALLFVLAALVLAAHDRWLLVLSGVAATLGPLVYWYGQGQAPAMFERDGHIGSSVGEVAHGLVLSGPYPLVTWAGPLLFGVWLGRRDLTDPRLQRRLIAIGAAVATATVVAAELVQAAVGNGEDRPGSVWRFLVATPHSQMPLWLVGSTAAAAAVLGASLWAAARWQRLLLPLAAAGQLALTIYVCHLVALHLGPDTLRSDAIGSATVIVVASSLVAVVLAVAWRSRFDRGPLEAVMRPPGWLR